MGDTTALVGDTDDYVLRCFTDRDFYWWWGSRATFVLLDYGLDGIAEELADDVFEV